MSDTVFPHRFFFFFNDTATTEIYTLSLHDALPISHVFHLGLDRRLRADEDQRHVVCGWRRGAGRHNVTLIFVRSEEHTSELQSRLHLVCRLLLEKKKRSKAPSSPLPTKRMCIFVRG